MLLLTTCLAGLSTTTMSQCFWHQTWLDIPLANNPIQKPGFKLILNDEFDAPPFNFDLWKRENYFHGDREVQIYVDDQAHPYAEGSGLTNYKYANGTYHGNSHLSLVALNTKAPEDMWGRQLDPEDPESPYVEDYDYTSAWFESVAEFKHGFFEMRCKLPKGPSFWPAFWLYYSSGDFNADGQEIDIFEIFGHEPRILKTNYHFTQSTGPNNHPYDAFGYSSELNRYGYSKGQDITITGSNGTNNFTNQFHTYGLEWRTNRLDFYLDNVLVRTVEDCNVPESFMKLIANLAIDNTPTPDPAFFPAEMQIDYIRVYKRIEVENFGYNTGDWRTDKHRRLIGDVNGDGKDDIVGFGGSQVFVSLGKADIAGEGFRAAHPVLTDFCFNQGWFIADHPIYLADVNGDGKDDIVGYGEHGVKVALSTTGSSSITPSFGGASYWSTNFGNSSSAGGYNPLYHPRMHGDVNGDGKQDLVVFSGAGVRVSLSTGSTFASSQLLITNFGSDASAGGWNTTSNRRMVADISGDGRDDIVGFGGSKVFYALSQGTTFASPQSSISNFTIAQGWSKTNHPIYLADANGDGKDDIIGFAGAGVLVATANGNGFNGASWWRYNAYGYDASAGGWRTDKHPRFVGDINNDGKADIIGFANNGVYTSLSNTTSYGTPTFQYNEYGYGSEGGDWRVDKHPRALADYNGDGSLDVIAFGDEGVFGHVSSYGCTQPCTSGKTGNPLTTGISEAADQSPLKVYPNPAEDILHFEAALQAGSNIELYDLNGRLVASLVVANSESVATLDVSQLEPGIYVYHVRSEDSHQKGKVVLQ